eukprot:evm.model.NODE_5589_length_28864_cov_20.848082.6
MPPTICFHKGNFEDAREKYIDALNTLGYQADLAYNIALCSYKLKQFGPALKYITEIIDRGVQEHPELSVGSNADGIEVRSVGNSPVLQETYLIEAFNLKFYDLAADMLAQSAGSAHSFLPPELYEYFEATILVVTSPEEAYRKYDDLTNKHIDQLRKLTKAIQDARIKLDNEAIKQALREYDEGLERYIPVLMAMARIYWERQNYAMVSLGQS